MTLEHEIEIELIELSKAQRAVWEKPIQTQNLRMNKMIVAQINLPVSGNNGENLGAVHFDVMRDLAAHFGGFTRTEGLGGWTNPRGELVTEKVAVYQVAFDDGHFNLVTFESIVKAAGKAAEQEAMFYIIDGNAQVITC